MSPAPHRAMTRCVVRRQDSPPIARHRMARPRSAPTRAVVPDDHRARMRKRLTGVHGLARLRHKVLLDWRFARGRSPHRTPNPYLWARERTLGGPHRYRLKARRLCPRAITGSPFAKAAYPLRRLGTGARGGHRSVAL